MPATSQPSGARRAPVRAAVVRAVAGALLTGALLPASALAGPAAATSGTRPATAVTLAPTPSTLAAARTARSATTRALAPVDAATGTDLTSRGLRTPEAASKNLWDAWRDDDTPRALLYASPAAVRTLFARQWDAEVRNQGCGRSNGIARCLYTEGPSAFVVTVSGSRATGYRVTRVDLLGRDAATAGLDPTATTAPRTATTVSTAADKAGDRTGSDRTATSKVPASTLGTLATGSASAAVRRAATPTPVAAASGPVGQVAEGDGG